MKKKANQVGMTYEEKKAYIARLNRRTRIMSIAAIVFGVLALLIQLVMLIRMIWF